MEEEVRRYLDYSANNMACSIVDINEAININKSERLEKILEITESAYEALEEYLDNS